MAQATANPIEQQRRVQLAANQARAQRQQTPDEQSAVSPSMTAGAQAPLRMPGRGTETQDPMQNAEGADQSQQPMVRQSRLQQRRMQARRQQAPSDESGGDMTDAIQQARNLLQRNPAHELQYTLLSKGLALVKPTVGLILIVMLPLYNLQLIWGTWLAKGKSFLVAPLTWDSFNPFREGFPPQVKQQLEKGQLKIGPIFIVLVLNILTAAYFTIQIGIPLLLLIVALSILQDPTAAISSIVTGEFGGLGSLAQQFIGIGI